MYTIYALLLVGLGQIRQKTCQRNFQQYDSAKFTTSGEIVVLVTVISVLLNVALIYLVVKL